MLPHNGSPPAVDHQQRIQHARFLRNVGEFGLLIGALLVTVLVATMGAHRTFTAYLIVSYGLILCEYLRRGIRRIVHAINELEALELSHSAPFLVLTAHWLGWICTSELLLGTGALHRPFSASSGINLSVLLVGAALCSVCARRALVDDVVTAIVWLALLFPHEAASHRTAYPALTVLRVVLMYAVHYFINARNEGRIFRVHIADATPMDIVRVGSAATASASQSLAQAGWILSSSPPLLTGIVLVLLANEFMARRKQPRKHSPRASSSASVYKIEPPRPVDERGTARHR